jgi:hypothetical protein
MTHPRLISLLTTLALAAACATSPLQTDPRYRFSGYEEVDSIAGYSVMGWEPVDSQSLIVQTGPSSYYLLILSHRVSDLNFAESIALSSTGNRIEAKFDCVRVVDRSCTSQIPAPIQTIYRLEGRASVQEVKDQIRR